MDGGPLPTKWGQIFLMVEIICNLIERPEAAWDYFVWSITRVEHVPMRGGTVPWPDSVRNIKAAHGTIDGVLTDLQKVCADNPGAKLVVKLNYRYRTAIELGQPVTAEGLAAGIAALKLMRDNYPDGP